MTGRLRLKRRSEASDYLTKARLGTAQEEVTGPLKRALWRQIPAARRAGRVVTSRGNQPARGMSTLWRGSPRSGMCGLRAVAEEDAQH